MERIHGFLNIDKPAGMTSHDVVARVRRLAGQRRVGHAGTLDPAATGVLVVALGVATRLIEYVQDQTSKRYQAVVRLGVTTSTDDAEGQLLASAPVPELAPVALEAILQRFQGLIQQVPPIYSALHHQGRRLYELARAGQHIELVARPVLIEALTLMAWDAPDLTLDVQCGKGTYIRALARDIGAAIGCGAHLHKLRRTAVGTFVIADAVPLQDLALVALSEVLLPPVVAVVDWPALMLDAQAVQRVRNGLPLVVEESIAADHARAHDPDGSLLALLARDGEQWRPEKVFDWTAS